MIGPHQGKELELMLSGQKHLSIFYEALVPGEEISEVIIPELAFAPHVESGHIIRLRRDFEHPKLPVPVMYICFTLPGHAWRAEAFFWMHEECISRRRPFDDAYEYFIGRLLDYSEEDIADYLRHIRKAA